MNARTMLRGACGQCFFTAAATVAEFVGDLGERLAEQVAARQQLREAVEFGFDVEDLAAVGETLPAIEELVGVLAHPADLRIDRVPA